jgi:hypothetical protein
MGSGCNSINPASTGVASIKACASARTIRSAVIRHASSGAIVNKQFYSQVRRSVNERVLHRPVARHGQTRALPGLPTKLPGLPRWSKDNFLTQLCASPSAWKDNMGIARVASKSWLRAWCCSVGIYCQRTVMIMLNCYSSNRDVRAHKVLDS